MDLIAANTLLSFLFARLFRFACFGRPIARVGALLMLVSSCLQTPAQYQRPSPAQFRAMQVVNTQSGFKSPAKVTSLKVKIVTRRNRGAGTDNAVYFDIGPLGWKLNTSLHNDFEAGSDYSFPLKFPEGLTTADILWLRFHKKGIAGVTGTKDGFDGAWHPKSITLIVNGAEYKTLPIDQPLNSRCWYWRSQYPDDSDLELFAHSLRMLPNKGLNFLDKTAGILTTNLFKRRGISGWLSNPAERECTGSSHENARYRALQPMCVTGEVIAKARSTDGLETVDLSVAKLESCPTDNRKCLQTVDLDVAHGFELARYLRVENRQAHNRVHLGNIVRICGKVRWDTDKEGWWEVHPRTSQDVQPLPPQ